MNTLLIPTSSPDALATALHVLQNGGLVALPTDTVYGLAALVTDGPAIDRLYQAKERSPQKAIAVLVGSLDKSTRLLPIFPRRHPDWPGASGLAH